MASSEKSGRLQSYGNAVPGDTKTDRWFGGMDVSVIDARALTMREMFPDPPDFPSPVWGYRRPDGVNCP